MNGDAELHENVSPLTNSLAANTPDALKYFPAFNAPKGRIRVRTVSLHSFMTDRRLDVIDILKLDIQGLELEALRGLGLKIETVKCIFVEVQFTQLYVGAPLFADIEIYLRGYGFQLHQLYGLVRSPDSGRLLYGDALFLNKTIARSV